MQQIEELVRQGVSQAKISRLTGFDRKTVRKYLKQADSAPRYGPRKPRLSKLDRFQPFIEERLKAGVWNAVVLLRELRERGYEGGYTILKDYLQPLREAAGTVAVRRFETPAGKQAQVDWGHLGEITEDGQTRKLWGFVFTLGHSRAMMGDPGWEIREIRDSHRTHNRFRININTPPRPRAVCSAQSRILQPAEHRISTDRRVLLTSEGATSPRQPPNRRQSSKSAPASRQPRSPITALSKPNPPIPATT